jgi:hypothetical protein
MTHTAKTKFRTGAAASLGAAGLSLIALLAVPGASAQPPVTPQPPFLGHWHVHDATMDITPTAATILASLGPCSAGSQVFCSETDTLTPASGDDTQLTLQVTAVNYRDSTGADVPNPEPGPGTAVGDSLRLTVQAPGLLKATILRGFPGWVGGNPYWCGAGISQADAAQCGA